MLLGKRDFQAAAAVGKPYLWAVDAARDGLGGVLFARLLTVLDGCVVPDPSRRLTVARVLESLTTLQRDLAVPFKSTVSASVTVSPSAAVSPSVSPPPVPAAAGASTTPSYDMLDVVRAMETLAIDTTSVVDALGGVTVSSLDALKTVGVPFVKCVALKRALSTTALPVSIPYIPAEVRTSSCGSLGWVTQPAPSSNPNCCTATQLIARLFLYIISSATALRDFTAGSSNGAGGIVRPRLR